MSYINGTRIISLNEILAERQASEKGDTRRVASLTRPIGEMITTADGLMDLVEV